MKKLFVSTGLAAIGVAGMQTAYGQGLDIVSPKAWSISGTLRGFYDDNYNISSTKKGSWGGEVSPTVSVNLPTRQTDMGMRYTYVLYYYNDRDKIGVDPFDQQHQVDIWLNHAINERWKINFTDTFTYGRSPDLSVAGSTPGTAATVFRTQGDNIANHAAISLDTQWTKLFGTSLHYGNDFYDYRNSGGTITNTPFAGGVPPGPFPVPGNTAFGNHPNQNASLGTAGASLSGLLDRVEQNVGLDFNWTLSPETTLFAGYTFSWVNYTGNEPIATFNYLGPGSVPQSYVYSSGSRDGTAHNAHIGLSRQLTANITLDATIGAAYSDNSNDPFSHSHNISPTASVSVNYTYLPGSYVQMGVTQNHNSTDVVQPGANGGITQYQDTTGVFADWNHKITEKLSGTLVAQYTYSTYEGGAAQSVTDSSISTGVNLSYQFNRHLSADAGYNFDDLLSGLNGRGFIRNRVYMGMTASY